MSDDLLRRVFLIVEDLAHGGAFVGFVVVTTRCSNPATSANSPTGLDFDRWLHKQDSSDL